jgi:hypothetical protein
MGTTRVLAVAICVGAVIGGCAAWHQTSVSAVSMPGQFDLGLDAVPDVLTDEAEFDIEPYTPRLDRYGNEIETAIGDYRVDPLGDMYERHSPDTALPQLAPSEV